MLLQEELAIKYKYQKLPLDISKNARKHYIETIPYNLDLNGSMELKLYSKEKTLISEGYNRIVIGDYGAFIEICPFQIIEENIKVQEGQEYRINDEKYAHTVKYFWLTTNDNSRCKIYLQNRKVSYADYKPEMFYISPFEIIL